MLPLDAPPAHIAPQPVPAGAVTLLSDFDAAASPAVKAWAATETAALLGAPLDLKRLERDAGSRASGASDPATAALILRYVVELRLEADFARRNAPAPRPSPTASGNQTPSQLMQATQGMQEMQMSFNMQYCNYRIRCRTTTVNLRWFRTS